MAARPYFIIGDIVTNSVAGVAAALGARALVGPDWHALLAVPAGMIAGTLASLPIAFLFMPLFGAFEVMLPALLTGMISGMLVGVLEATRSLSPVEAAGWGALSGIVSIAWVYALTAWVRSRDRVGSSERA
jgi:hypothetical protein